MEKGLECVLNLRGESFKGFRSKALSTCPSVFKVIDSQPKYPLTGHFKSDIQ
jgi:hypothetical protein